MYLKLRWKLKILKTLQYISNNEISFQWKCVFTSSLSPPPILPMNRAPPRPAAETQIKYTQTLACVPRVSEGYMLITWYLCVSRMAWSGLLSIIYVTVRAFILWYVHIWVFISCYRRGEVMRSLTNVFKCVCWRVCDQPPLLMSLFSSSFSLFCLIFIAISASWKKKAKWLIREVSV